MYPFKSHSVQFSSWHNSSLVPKYIVYSKYIIKDLLNKWVIWKRLLLFSHSVVSDSLQPHGLQHPRLPCPSPSPWACSNSCPLSWWYHPTISFSVIPFSSRLQAFPASGSFPMSQFFSSSGQSIEASATALVLPINIQGWFHLGQSRGLSRIFPKTTVQKGQFFGAQPFLQPNSHIHTWLLKKKHNFDKMDLCQQSNVFAF